MDKFKKIAAAAWRYIKSRGIGFWLLLPVAVLSLIIPFIYRAQFGEMPDYWAPVVFALPLLAFAAYALSFCKYTARYSGIAMFALSLAGLLMFVNTIYYYIADVIFKADDVSIAGIFKHVDTKVIFIIVAYFINLLLCAVSSFFKQYRTVKVSAETEAAEVKS